MTSKLIQQCSLGVQRLARFGYAAKSDAYGIVALLATQAAVGYDGQTSDTRSALSAIVTQLLGKFLLSLVGICLIAYSLWRFI